jgi:hypothetical protein
MVFTCLILIGKAIAGRGGKIPKVISLTEPNAIELLRTKGRVSVPEYYRGKKYSYRFLK